MSRNFYAVWTSGGAEMLCMFDTQAERDAKTGTNPDFSYLAPRRAYAIMRKSPRWCDGPNFKYCMMERPS